VKGKKAWKMETGKRKLENGNWKFARTFDWLAEDSGIVVFRFSIFQFRFSSFDFRVSAFPGKRE